MNTFPEGHVIQCCYQASLFSRIDVCSTHQDLPTVKFWLNESQKLLQIWQNFLGHKNIEWFEFDSNLFASILGFLSPSFLQAYHQGKCMQNWFWALVPPFLHSLNFLLQSVLITLAIYSNFFQVCHKGKCLQKGTGAPAAPISHSLNPIFSTHPNALCKLSVTLYLLTWVGVNLDVIT